jgi:hypothetical protein
MKNFFNAIKFFFVEKGIFKIFGAFILLMISVIIIKSDLSPLFQTIFKWTGLLSLIYLGLVFLIFFISGVIGAIKDHK